MRLLAALAATLLAAPVAAEEAVPPPLFPTNFGGAYALTDHHGNTRTQADPDGHLQLIFFGYASCEAICTVALPVMAEVSADLAARGIPTTPLVITVDPERDTVDSMGHSLAHIAPGLTGLTGSEEALAQVRDLFHVERTPLFEEPLGGTVYTHGSHIYVMDGDGAFLTLLPPILSVERMVEIVTGYASG